MIWDEFSSSSGNSKLAGLCWKNVPCLDLYNQSNFKLLGCIKLQIYVYFPLENQREDSYYRTFTVSTGSYYFVHNMSNILADQFKNKADIAPAAFTSFDPKLVQKEW